MEGENGGKPDLGVVREGAEGILSALKHMEVVVNFFDTPAEGGDGKTHGEVILGLEVGEDGKLTPAQIEALRETMPEDVLDQATPEFLQSVYDLAKSLADAKKD